MSTLTTSTSRSGGRRRRQSNYNRLQTEKKAETRSKYITAGVIGLLLLVLLVSLGIIAFNLGG